ncbi:MAG: hypothetical protein GTO40_15155, partial [Deltaproteobacteria bacterium]|nr:hypothetical protein [Deltaproteobacteria bacterium]
MGKILRSPHLVAATAAVLFVLVFGAGNAFSQVVPAMMDVKPGSCVNPLNVKSRGVLPVAILGTDDFDVTSIDPASILLQDSVMPLRTAAEDDASAIDCNDQNGDGLLDLLLKFDSQETIAALGQINDGDVIILSLGGSLLDGSEFAGQDT